MKANIKNILPIQSASVTLVWQKYFVGAICQRPHHGQSLGCTWAASQPPRCRCDGHGPLTRYVQLRMRRECRERCPRHRLQRKPIVSNPGMHHGTCGTHVPWCMSGSLTRGGGQNAPGIPGACAIRNFMYLIRGPWRIHHGRPCGTDSTLVSLYSRNHDGKFHSRTGAHDRFYFSHNIFSVITLQKLRKSLPNRRKSWSEAGNHRWVWNKKGNYTTRLHWNLFNDYQYLILG